MTITTGQVPNPVCGRLGDKLIGRQDVWATKLDDWATYERRLGDTNMYVLSSFSEVIKYSLHVYIYLVKM